MAALRYAARRLCERALQGAPRIPPGRRPMSMMTSNNINNAKQREPYTCEELKKQLAESEQALEDCLRQLSKQSGQTVVATNTGITRITLGSLRNTGFSSAQNYGIIGRIGFHVLPFFLGGVYFMQKFSEHQKKEDGATSKNTDAN